MRALRFCAISASLTTLSIHHFLACSVARRDLDNCSVLERSEHVSESDCGQPQVVAKQGSEELLNEIQFGWLLLHAIYGAAVAL